MKYTKEYIARMRVASNLLEPPANEVVVELLDEIERLQSENRWHDFPDEKPESYKLGLPKIYEIVTDRQEYYPEAVFNSDGDWVFNTGSSWEYVIGKVEKWRPLPQPPESEG